MGVFLRITQLRRQRERPALKHEHSWWITASQRRTEGSKFKGESLESATVLWSGAESQGGCQGTPEACINPDDKGADN